MIHTSCVPGPAVKHLREAELGPASRELKIFKQLNFFNHLLQFDPALLVRLTMKNFCKNVYFHLLFSANHSQCSQGHIATRIQRQGWIVTRLQPNTTSETISDSAERN